MRRISILVGALLIGTIVLPARDAAIDPRQSLAITDHAILSTFAFSRVMKELVAQSGVPRLTELTLFQQWWDSQNPAPGYATGARHYCDDVLVVNP